MFVFSYPLASGMIDLLMVWSPTGTGKGVDCLRSLSTETLIKANEDLIAAFGPPFTGPGPVVDGNLVPDLPSYLFAQGRFHKNISLLVSNDIDEVCPPHLLSRFGFVGRLTIHRVLDFSAKRTSASSPSLQSISSPQSPTSPSAISRAYIQHPAIPHPTPPKMSDFPSSSPISPSTATAMRCLLHFRIAHITSSFPLSLASTVLGQHSFSSTLHGRAQMQLSPPRSSTVSGGPL